MSNHYSRDIKANTTYRNPPHRTACLHLSPKTKGQRVYQPLSSAFSRKSSPGAEPIPPSAAALSNPGPNQEEDVVPDIVEKFCGPVEDDGGQGPRQEPTTSDSVDEAIPEHCHGDPS